MNPQHTIPLLDDNGTLVADSHAICAYLIGKYAPHNQSLYPKELARRALVDARLHFDTGFLFARLRFLFEPIVYFGIKTIPADKIEYIQRCWPIMERFLETSHYLCGPNVTIADFCAISTVCSLDKLAPIDAELYPKFTAWIERLEALPYFEEVCGAPGKAVQAFVEEKANE